MPIYLAPISRRRFLARALTAGAGLVFVPELLADTKKTDPDCWALFSDVHVAADQAMAVRKVKMAEHFAQACREVLALPRRPAGLLISGDCAYNSGQPGDYLLLKEMLEAIRAGQIPVHLAVGNHDNRANFWDAFAEEKQAMHPVPDRQVALVQTPRANWFIMDSLEKTLSTPGLLGHDQLQWLAEALDANTKKPALIVVHHNPGLEGGNMGLKDTMLLLEVLRPRKHVKAYIFGHTHSWRVEQDPSGMHLINLPALAYVFKEGDPSGWVTATLRRNGISLRLCCIDATDKRNGQTVELKWRS